MRFRVTAPFGPQRSAVGSLNRSFVPGLGLTANIRLQSCDMQPCCWDPRWEQAGSLKECYFQGKA